MDYYSSQISKLIEELSRLPGIGAKTAQRLAFHIINMPKEQVQATLRRVKEMMEQKTALNKNQSMAEYTNPGPMENSIYFATHNGQGAITVESVGGDVEVKNLADLD